MARLILPILFALACAVPCLAPSAAHAAQEVISIPRSSLITETTATLGAGATYTSEVMSVAGHGLITVFVTSDQDSAASGLKLQFSQDGTNWDYETTFTLNAGVQPVELHSLVPVGRWFRLQYVNGSTPQGMFRAQVIARPNGPSLTVSAEALGSAEIVPAKISVGNTRANADLAAGATFTGAWEDVHSYSSITVIQKGDAVSADNGFKMEFSMDGVTVTRSKSSYARAGESALHSLAVVAQFFRVVYTQNATTGGDVEIETIYHPTKPRDLSSSANQIMRDNDDVTFTRPSSTHELDVARGLYSEQSWVNQFGHNDAVGNGSVEAIWFAGGDYTGFMQAADQIEILSSDVDDDSDGAGTNAGAQRIIISGPVSIVRTSPTWAPVLGRLPVPAVLTKASSPCEARTMTSS
jgi:hypothetical protein